MERHCNISLDKEIDTLTDNDRYFDRYFVVYVTDTAILVYVTNITTLS